MAGSTTGYTWEDFLKELEGSGLKGQFSDADMRLAQAHPDAGRSILSYKRDYMNATNDQARALANAGAERVRSSFGGYTAGEDGSGYYRDSLSPKDFTYGEAPSFQSRHDGQIQELLQGLVNRPDFSYDVEKDPLYTQYRKQYVREGQRASQDAMGQAAAMSGGLPSSYAGTAAGQAANYYNAQLTDKIPELEELAFQKYMNDFDMDRVKLQSVQDADNADYQRYLGQLDQYNADRSFAYGQHMDEVASQRQNQEDLWDRAQTAAQYGDYKGLNELGVDTSGFQSQQERERAVDDALLRAQYGDYSGLQALGVDTSGYLSSQDMWQRGMDYQREQDALAQQNWERQFSYGQSQDALARDQDDYQRRLQMAQIQAQYGDYSGLQALGVDTSGYEASAKASAGGDAGYKPVNSYEQVMEQIAAGIMGPQTMKDYKYYTGQSYFNGVDGSVTPVNYDVTGGTMTQYNLSDTARSIDNQIESKLGALTKLQIMEMVNDAYERGDITDEEFPFFAARYGIKLKGEN